MLCHRMLSRSREERVKRESHLEEEALSFFCPGCDNKAFEYPTFKGLNGTYFWLDKVGRTWFVQCLAAGANFWRQNMRNLHNLSAETNEDFAIWIQRVVMRGMALAQQPGPQPHESFRQMLMRCFQAQQHHDDYWDSWLNQKRLE